VKKNNRENPAGGRTTKAGYVALIGRTNVGKSTFLNRIMEAKVAIVSDSPQTTRRQILGIHTDRRGQIVFFDSPGIHKPHFKLNERMMKDVYSSLMDADIILYFVEIDDRRPDAFILGMIRDAKQPLFLIINKIDKYSRGRVLERIQAFKDLTEWDEIVPMSALRGDNVDHLETLLFEYLPPGEPFFPPEELTRQSDTYYVAELIREKVLRHTRQELPFTTSVKVQEMTDREKIRYIRAEIYVETHSQKKILVGKGGHLVKQVGAAARVEIEEYLGKKVYLDLYIKVVPGWRNSPQFLKDIFD